ncbi:MAG: hypothetical protein ACP5OH_02155 [Nitrososphaerota archaeon]
MGSNSRTLALSVPPKPSGNKYTLYASELRNFGLIFYLSAITKIKKSVTYLSELSLSL